MLEHGAAPRAGGLRQERSEGSRAGRVGRCGLQLGQRTSACNAPHYCRPLQVRYAEFDGPHTVSLVLAACACTACFQPAGQLLDALRAPLPPAAHNPALLSPALLPGAGAPQHCQGSPGLVCGQQARGGLRRRLRRVPLLECCSEWLSGVINGAIEGAGESSACAGERGSGSGAAAVQSGGGGSLEGGACTKVVKGGSTARCWRAVPGGEGQTGRSRTGEQQQEGRAAAFEHQAVPHSRQLSGTVPPAVSGTAAAAGTLHRRGPR